MKNEKYKMQKGNGDRFCCRQLGKIAILHFAFYILYFAFPSLREAFSPLIPFYYQHRQVVKSLQPAKKENRHDPSL